MITHIQTNILTVPAQCIVNPANPALAPGGGLSGKIHATYPSLHESTMELYPLGLHTGEATRPIPVEGLHQYVIHTVGPKHINLHASSLLREAYWSAFDSALRSYIKSMAVPLISSGIYGIDPLVSFTIGKSVALEFPNINITFVEFKS